MKPRTIIHEHPYYGRREYSATDIRDALSDALTDDHDCDDPGCDIGTAHANGYVIAAAWMLTGATECESVDAVIAFYWAHGTAEQRAELGTHLYDCADWEGWKAHHDEYGRPCDACGSYTYAEVHYEPERCANCWAPLPRPPADRAARAVLLSAVGSDDDTFPAYAWPGGYPIAYVTDDADTLCAECVNTEPDVHFAGDNDGWRVVGWSIHYEGPAEHCAHCNRDIPSAYGDPDAD